jgi:hypothetical protein
MACEADHGDHGAHASGLAAFMKIGHSPLSLLGPVRPSLIMDSNANVRVSSFMIPKLEVENHAVTD